MHKVVTRESVVSSVQSVSSVCRLPRPARKLCAIRCSVLYIQRLPDYEPRKPGEIPHFRLDAYREKGKFSIEHGSRTSISISRVQALLVDHEWYSAGKLFGGSSTHNFSRILVRKLEHLKDTSCRNHS